MKRSFQKKFFKLGAIFSIAMLSSCFSMSPVSYEQAEPVQPSDQAEKFAAASSEEDGKLVILRDKGWVASACSVRVHINGEFAGNLRNQGERIEFWVPTGETSVKAQLFGCLDDSIANNEFIMKPKQTKMLRLTIPLQLFDPK